MEWKDKFKLKCPIGWEEAELMLLTSNYSVLGSDIESLLIP